MIVTVRFFAAARDAADVESRKINVPDRCTVQQLRGLLVECLPGLRPLAASLIIAVNQEYVADETVLNSSDEVACFPPVSGG